MGRKEKLIPCELSILSLSPNRLILGAAAQQEVKHVLESVATVMSTRSAVTDTYDMLECASVTEIRPIRFPGEIDGDERDDAGDDQIDGNQGGITFAHHKQLRRDQGC